MAPAVGGFSGGKDLMERFALVGGAVLGHQALSNGLSATNLKVREHCADHPGKTADDRPEQGRPHLKEASGTGSCWGST
jgi:hypothetical protein